MSRGPALLTRRPFLLLAPAAVLFACRSAVAPPSPLPDEAAGLPSGMLDTTPGALLKSGSPRRECPLPANLIADLEEKMVERLGQERKEFLDGFAALETQRSAFVADLRAVAARRAAAPPAVEGPEFAAEAAAARAAVAAPIDAVLGETLAWLEPDVLFSAGSASQEPRPPAPSRPHGDGKPAPAGSVALAQGTSPYEGQWILPLVRMMAGLRGRFAGVSAAQASAEALFRALRAAERRLHRALEVLPPAVPVPVGPTDGGSATGRRAAPHAADEEDRRRAAVVAAARNAARDEAEADLRRLLAALERARPEGCRPDVGSVVCRPAPVDVWTGSEFTLLQPGDPVLRTGPLLDLLDRLSPKHP